MFEYDVVVIGIDICGLSIAALLQKEGYKVAIIEHKYEVKDDVQNIREAISYRWDSKKGALSVVLNRLGIEQSKIAEEPKYVDMIIVDSYSLCRKFGWKQYKDQLCELYPKETSNIEFYFQELQELAAEWERLLIAGSVFKAGSLKRMLHYKGTTYKQFVKQVFNNCQLQRILLIDLPSEDTALPVMAGYLVTQVFDSHYMEKKLLEETLLKKFLELNGIILTSQIKKVKNEEVVKIEQIDGSIINCIKLVSTYDKYCTMCTYFSELHEDVTIKKHRMSNVLVASINNWEEQKINPNSIVIDLCLGVDNSMRCWVELSRKSNQVFIEWTEMDREIPSEFFLTEVLKCLNKSIGLNVTVEKYKIYTAKQIETALGMEGGDINRWAFTCDEMQKNVLKDNVLLPNIYTAGQWGRAWFTAAISVTNNFTDTLRS